jgi:hypothetical protein
MTCNGYTAPRCLGANLAFLPMRRHSHAFFALTLVLPPAEGRGEEGTEGIIFRTAKRTPGVPSALSACNDATH